jgi:putative transposase
MKSVDASGLKKFSHSVGQNWYHIVLIPKYRYPVFSQKKQHDLADEAIQILCKNHSIDLFAYEIMDDHVHLFVSCPPDYSIRKLIGIIKGGTSYYIRKNHLPLKKYKSLWGEGSMYRSIGSVSADILEKYIEDKNNWDFLKSQKKLI